MDETVNNVSRISGATSEALSLDDAFDILADRDRRRLLTVLDQMETPERLSALTRNLVAVTGRSGADEVEELHICLYHYHVPKLADAGLVSYDENQGTVELTEQGQALAAGLDH